LADTAAAEPVVRAHLVHTFCLVQVTHMAKFEITWLEDTSDEALLSELRRVAALMPNQSVTTDAFDSHSRISASAVIRRFGTWSEAKRRAGLADAAPVYTDAAIIEDLQRVARSSPREPFTQEFYLTHGGRYSRSLFKTRFGGWREVLTSAKLANRFAGRPVTERMRSQPGRNVSNPEILAKIRNIAARLGKTSLTGADIAANCDLNQGLLKSRFGSVPEALRQAGIEQGNRGRRYTDDEVFQNLLNVWTHYGRRPTHSEMDRPPSAVGSNTYIRRYGGWRSALNAFVERANSDTAELSELSSGSRHTTETSHPDLPDTPAISATDANGPPSTRQIAKRTGTPPRTRRDAERVNKRDPSWGLRFKVLQRDRFRCQLCGRSPATNLSCNLHVDHIVPYSKGGRTTLENLRTLCAECNIGRGNRSQ